VIADNLGISLDWLVNDSSSFDDLEETLGNYSRKSIRLRIYQSLKNKYVKVDKRFTDDFLENENDASYYNTDQFYQITLQGGEEHPACTDYRDAFSGTTMVSLSGDIYEKEPASFEIEMKRPIAKFEFISDDVEEFIEKETTKIQQNINTNAATNNVCLDDYIVTIYYVGYMPNTYSLFTDKPTNSQTGIMFSSTVTQINNTEVSLGFDYVFVKDNISSITVQISISNKNGEKLSTSLPINVPLKRDYHTIIRGKFLTSNASGGVSINPDYDGEHNLILP
jgi:hypothetical protein